MNDEATLVSTFVNPLKRKHLIEILANPKRRHRATATLAHFEGAADTPAAIESALRSRGAGDNCHVISENRAIDGKTLSLKAALEKVVGQGSGTLLSCVPGELAYYEGQAPSDRCILARPSG